MGKFKQLAFELIEEGRFEKAVNESLERLQAHLVEYVERHGKEKATKAKARLQVSVTLQFDGPNAEDFSIKGELRESVPSRPAVVTRAVADLDDSGIGMLWVRASGSTEDSQNQGILITKDGDVVDQETGEVVKGKKTAKL